MKDFTIHMEIRPLKNLFRVNEWWFVLLLILASATSAFWSFVPMTIALFGLASYVLYLWFGVRCPNCKRKLKPESHRSNTWVHWVYPCSHCDIAWDSKMSGPEAGNAP